MSYRLHPVAVKVIVSLLFIESHQPSTPELVPVILPHGLDPILGHEVKHYCITRLKFDLQCKKGTLTLNKQ